MDFQLALEKCFAQKFFSKSPTNTLLPPEPSRLVKVADVIGAIIFFIENVERTLKGKSNGKSNRIQSN